MATALKTRLLGSQSDERLLELARGGSQIAFEALARRYRRALLRHCRQLCLSEEGAQEVLQRSLAEAWGGIRADAERRDLPSWLREIAQRIAAEQMHSVAAASASERGGAARGSDAPGAGAAAGGAPTPDEVLALRGALAAMTPRREHDGIVVHRMNGNKAKVATEEAFELADTAVRGLLGRARRGISALTPPPLLAWALGRAAEGGPAGERIAELGAGGGAAGLALKGAVVAITAGVAITGAVVVQSKSHPHAGGHARRGDLVRPGSTNVTAQTPAAAHGATLAAGPGGGERRGGHRGSHRLIASITPPTRAATSPAQTTQGAGSGSTPASGASPSNQGAAGPQPTGGGQTSASSTQTTSSSAVTSGASAPAGTESPPTGSAGQTTGEGIGVHISVGSESGQQESGGGAAGGSSSSSPSEPSSSSESSKGIGIGISISLEPIASIGVHVSLP